MMERSYAMQFTLGDADTDTSGVLTASAMLRFAQIAAGENCQRLGAAGEALGNLFWAVLRYRVEITRLPRRGETITVKTWPMPTTKAAYPRATEGCDETGETLFKIMSLWVLMDKDSRTMVLPGKSGITVEGAALGGELPVPATLHSRETDRESFRTVEERDIDQNRHMNNTRYLAWATELLDPAFRRQYALKGFTICYLSEARLGQKIHLKWTVSEGPEVYLEGLREAGEKRERCFAAKMEFERIM